MIISFPNFFFFFSLIVFIFGNDQLIFTATKMSIHFNFSTCNDVRSLNSGSAESDYGSSGTRYWRNKKSTDL